MFSKPSSDEKSSGIVLYLFIAILTATLGLQLYNRFKPETSSVPLLPKSSEMTTLTTYEDIKTRSLFSVPFPEKLFGSELYVAGIYGSPVKLFPAHSIAMVFVKNHARFVELDVLPSIKSEQILNQFGQYTKDVVAINAQQTGSMIHLRKGFDCTQPASETIPAVCLITNMLIFEKDGNTIILSSDGDHITEGELLEMARSIK